VRFHIQQDSDIPASTQLNNQICFAIAARHFPPGHRLPSTRQLAMQTGLHRNTISKVYRQLEMDGVVEAIAGSGIYVRDNLTKREFTKSLYSKDKISKAPDQEAKKLIDNLISLGCTLQETRDILTNEIDWRIKCGSRIIVSTPREDIGASMLIAEDLSTTINVPVEVVPMEELEKVLSNSNNGTIVTSRYFIQPLEKVAKQHGVRAIAVDLSDFQKELKILKEIIEPTIQELNKKNIDYRGVIYFGLMITKSGPKVIEYNCRFGDPECQTIMPLMDQNFVFLLEKCSMGNLTGNEKINTSNKVSGCVVATSKGYPQEYKTGFPIKIGKIDSNDCQIFDSGTSLSKNGQLLTDGGRVLSIVCQDKDYDRVFEKAYKNLKEIHFEGIFFRNDIGHQVRKNFSREN